MSSLPAVHWQCPPKTVLVAVDFGDASARALAIGGVVASVFGARLLALHVEQFEAPPYFTLEQIARLEAERRVAQAAATDHLARFAAEAAAYSVESVVRVATIPVLVTRAATTPARDVFERIAFVQDRGHAESAARTCAEHLASIAGGSLVEGGSVAQCEAGVMQGASLVVIATSHDRPSWGITDSVAKVLGACQRPLLFIPPL